MKRYLVYKFLIVLTMLSLVALSTLTGCSSNAATTSSPAPATSPAQNTTNVPATSSTAATTPAAASGPVVKIGAMGGQTGPAAGPVTFWFTQMTNFFKYWNEVQGGVDGIKLEWKTADNKGTPEGAITAYKELRDNFSPQIYVAIEDYYLAGIRDMINQDGSTIVTTSPMDPRFYVPPQHFFSIAISSADGLAGYAKWLKETYKGSTPLKLGILYWDFASGEMAVNMAKPYIAKIGVDSTAVVYKYSDLSLQTPLMRLRDAGVTHIWMLANSSQAAMVIKEMKGLGLTGKIDICFNEMVESDVVISLAGAEAEGCYILRSESPYSDNTEAAQLYTKMWDWAGKKGLWADNRLPLTLQAVIVGAIKQAAADVGKDKIDKAAIYNALNKLTAIDTWGNSKDFGYGQDRRLGVQTMKIAKFTKTGTISASDYIVMPRVFEGIDNK